jgi:hypothetical protein
MANIIIPARHRADGEAHPFKTLWETPAQMQVAFTEFVRILAASFRDDAVRDGHEFALRHNTDAERKRRTAIMDRWYRTLRAEGFGHVRAMDELSRALRAELDGAPYTMPERNRVWAPGEA